MAKKQNIKDMQSDLLAMIPVDGVPYADLVEAAQEARIDPALMTLRKLEKAGVVSFRFVDGVNTVFKLK